MKIRVIGDHNVGRRSLIIAGTVDNKFKLEDAEYINQGMVDFYFSSPSTHVITKMKLDGMPLNVNIKMDPCAGEAEDIEMFRRIGYSMTDIFLFCFSIMIPESLENVSKIWIPKIRDYWPTEKKTETGTETGREKVKTHNRLLRFPIILLVGTQIDLRQDRATLDKLADKNLTPISSKVGVKVAKQIGAAKYVKCSALTKEGLKGVESIIDQACYERLKHEEKKRKTCTIS